MRDNSAVEKSKTSALFIPEIVTLETVYMPPSPKGQQGLLFISVFVCRFFGSSVWLFFCSVVKRKMKLGNSFQVYEKQSCCSQIESSPFFLKKSAQGCRWLKIKWQDPIYLSCGA